MLRRYLLESLYRNSSEDAPVVETHWNARQRDENIVRFGRLWKCYDLVGSLGLDYRPGILTYEAPLLGGYLCGGIDGHSFLVLFPWDGQSLIWLLLSGKASFSIE